VLRQPGGVAATSRQQVAMSLADVADSVGATLTELIDYSKEDLSELLKYELHLSVPRPPAYSAPARRWQWVHPLAWLVGVT
jgi:hypothetical protein